MDRRQQIIVALEQGLESSVEFFEALTAEELDKRIYQDGARWTAQQVVAHFITIEQSMQWLFKNILSGGEGSPENFDVDRYNESQTGKFNDVPFSELIALFRQVRRQTIGIVASMSESDLDLEGRHAFHGHGKLERFIRWAYEHARIHEDEIRQALNKP